MKDMNVKENVYSEEARKLLPVKMHLMEWENKLNLKEKEED